MKTRLLFLLSLLILASAPAPRQEPEAPDTFRPTETLPADSGVSFPIDI